MTQTSSSAQVLVLGSGIVSRACALALAHSGLKVKLLSADSVLSNSTVEPELFDSRVFALNAASRELLERLKVWPAMPAARITPVDRMVVDHFGWPVNFDAYEARQPALAWIVESRELQSALEAAVKFHPLIERITAAQAVKIELNEASAQVHSVWHSAPLLVVADVPSAGLLRASNTTHLSFDEVDYQSTALVGTLRATQPHRNTAYQWFGKCEGAAEPEPSVLALLPLPSPSTAPGNYASLVWSTTQTDALLASENLAEQLTQATHQTLGALTLQGELKRWPLSRSLAREVAQPRAVLLGDAAHRVHPLAGQGLNLGLQDVAALAAVLEAREAFRDIGDVKLLQRYARARAAQVKAVASLTHGMWRITERLARPGATIQTSAISPYRAPGLAAAFAWAQAAAPVRMLKRQLVRAANGQW